MTAKDSSGKNPVDHEVYDERWLSSAWGSRANDELLTAERISPRPRLKRAFELAALRPGHTLLDIACGRGEMPALAAEQGVNAVGLDFSQASLDFAHQLRQTHHSRWPSGATMELVRADACHLPFQAGTFDRITMLDIIEHLVPVQLESMIREVRRVLKPDGYAILHTLPNRWVYDITFPILHRLYPKFRADPRGDIEKEIHVNEQDLPKLHHLLKRCGLHHHLWLEQHMAAQARWNMAADKYGDQRDQLYPILAGWMGHSLEWLSMTPARLLLANDIFGVAWKSDRPPVVRFPLALTERLICRLSPSRKDPYPGR